MSSDRKSAEAIAKALGGAQLSNTGWWSCKCPAHEDRTASLGLKDTEDGRVAWHCRAHCSTREVANALEKSAQDYLSRDKAVKNLGLPMAAVDEAIAGLTAKLHG